MRFKLNLPAPPPPYRPLLAVCAAAWPVWRWYLVRSFDGSSDPVEILALLTAVGLFFHHKPRVEAQRPWQWAAAAGMMAVYAASFASVYPMIRAGLVVMALSLLLWHTRASLALALLLFLSLPVAATLQFFLGYPLRLVVAEASCRIVEGLGWEVFRVGTALHWAGETILVDAPCSGLKMLWAGCFFAAALAYWKQLSALRTISLQGIGVVLLIAANILRATVLFFKESRILPLPEWTHAATGLVIFAGAALALLSLGKTLARSTAVTSTASTAPTVS